MKERPILFTGEMVRAILDGRKTQTRRPVKPQPFEDAKWGLSWAPRGIANNKPIYCERNANFNPITKAILGVGAPLGTIGDRLWVRETFSTMDRHPMRGDEVAYRADGESLVWEPWTPSIHMPRWASRIDLEITAVRVERVQDMEGMNAADSDALKEGVNRIHHEGGNYYYSAFRNHPHPQNWTDPFLAFNELWQSIYANWDANPWVWVYEFRRIKP